MATILRPCSRCGERCVSTPRNSYCKPCRAAYQREWRLRRLGEELAEAEASAPLPPRARLRGTPTRAEMIRYGLV